MCLGIPGQLVEFLDEPRAPRSGRRDGVGRIDQHRPARGRGPAARRLGAHPRRLRDVEDRRGRGEDGARWLQLMGRRTPTSSTRSMASRTGGRHEVRRRVPRPGRGARRWSRDITELAGDDTFKFMEVCGGHTHTIYRHGIEHVLPHERRAGARPRLPGVRDPDGPRRRRHRRRRDAGRDLHVVRRHDARARAATGTCSRPRRAAPTCASCTRRSTRLQIAVDTPTGRSCSSPSGSRPRRRRPR